MEDSFDSTDRSPTDFLLFATGFFGFVLGATGVVVASPATALIGGLMMILAVAAFLVRP
jgi:hypothetical protein